MFANLRNRLTRTQWIAVGFLLIILCGTCLLMLPISSRMPGGTDFLSALFTAASATCVTGLDIVRPDGHTAYDPGRRSGLCDFWRNDSSDDGKTNRAGRPGTFAG